MAISEREHYIKVLEKMFYGMEKLENGVILPTSEVKTALAYAISSLKTDEMYQLEYENRDCVEVIRCKDCEWFGNIGCAIQIIDDSDKPTENDFCSFANKKEQEQ